MDSTAMSMPAGAIQFTLPDTSLAEDQLLERQRRWLEFLNRDNNVNADATELERIILNDKPRLVVSMDHIREFDAELAEQLMAEPAEFIPGLEAAATEAGRAAAVRAGVALDAGQFRVAVGFSGAFGTHHVTPRGLRARQLGRLVCVEGIVTRCSLVRPKVERSVHYAAATRTFFAKTYRDQSSGGTGFSSAYPTADDKGHALTTEFGLSRYTDHQTINIQEMPERAPPGQLPRGVDVVLDGDLVDAVKPGDRVAIVGVYRALGGKATTAAAAIFRTVLMAGAVRVFGAGSLAATKPSSGVSSGIPGAMALTEGDITNIHAIAKRTDAFELLAQSLAPSICGHAEIKRAVLLQQLGGVEKNLENGTHIRGDVNVLMVGDPSTAKSQLLRYVLRIAPLAIATTGRGSSGVGLTAAVVADKDSGERRLEAGAMVLADRGVVCIDEFDKMTDVDRVAIHEVMEQQTVTVAKAGIHTTLNARCSVLAAANPVYGRYDPKRPPHQNIALPDSLLSRFDLLFIVTDSMDEARDRAISAHVLRMHRYVPPGVEPGQPLPDMLDQGLGTASLLAAMNGPDASADGAARPCTVFEPFNEYLHAGVAAAPPRRGRGRPARNVAPKREVLSTEFLRRFLYFAKNMVRPVLADAAADDLARAYAELRAQASGQGIEGRGATGAVQTTTPVTARTLETLIRLATAHAKLRLSTTVDAEDAEVAKGLLRFALFKEKPATAQRQSRASRRKAKRVRTSDDDTVSDISSDEDVVSDHAADQADQGGLRPMQTAQPLEPESAMDVDEISADRLALFKTQLSKAMGERRLDASTSPWSFPEPFVSIINDGLAGHPVFSLAEAEHALQAMEAENRLMFRDNMIIMM
ncbi:MCM DNA helicase complex subunit [Coemansia sp. RSA 564]|nr:MCM DNA helicase complex subunit [Coemansia sp. RSA 564]